MNSELTDEELIECFDLVFESTHSPGFKKSEMKDLLFTEGYWFMEKPKDNWLGNLTGYLRKVKPGLNLDKTNLPKFKNE